MFLQSHLHGCEVVVFFWNNHLRRITCIRGEGRLHWALTMWTELGHAWREITALINVHANCATKPSSVTKWAQDTAHCAVFNKNKVCLLVMCQMPGTLRERLLPAFAVSGSNDRRNVLLYPKLMNVFKARTTAESFHASLVSTYSLSWVSFVRQCAHVKKLSGLQTGLHKSLCQQISFIVRHRHRVCVMWKLPPTEMIIPECTTYSRHMAAITQLMEKFEVLFVMGTACIKCALFLQCSANCTRHEDNLVCDL